jgi:hypothetical protein
LIVEITSPFAGGVSDDIRAGLACYDGDRFVEVDASAAFADPPCAPHFTLAAVIAAVSPCGRPWSVSNDRPKGTCGRRMRTGRFLWRAR